MHRQLLILAIILAALLSSSARAQTSAFTYQGRLTDNAIAANGNYDIRFTLHSAVTGGPAVGSPLIANPVLVSNGLFTVQLDFGANFPGADRWLEIAVRPAGSVATHTVLTPRQKLTSAPYATRAASAATVSGNISASQISGGTLATSVIGDGSLPATKLSLDSIAATQIATGGVGNAEIAASAITADKMAATVGVWNKSGTTINYMAGNVGMGTNTPTGGLLDVEGDVRINDKDIFLRGGSDTGHGLGWYGSGKLWGTTNVDGPVLYGWNAGGLGIIDPDVLCLTWDYNGNVTVGSAERTAAFKVITGVGDLTIRNDSGLVPVIDATGTGGLAGIVRFRNILEVWPNNAGTSAGKIDIRNTTGAPTITLDGQSGDANVKTLTITGGSDVAEPFHMTGDEIPKGAVVVIDEDHPGRLKLSDRAYDTRVAGIVSGANGIDPGLSLRQSGVLDGGQNVALTGRVYAMADASAGPICPGDLLTTADTAGHVMKARDRERGQGAILGKAMSRLDGGTGWVLVLVNLQ